MKRWYCEGYINGDPRCGLRVRAFTRSGARRRAARMAYRRVLRIYERWTVRP